MRAPMATSIAIRSSTSGSWAAFSMTVVPSARVAASMAFSVPMTVTYGKVIVAPRSRSGAREVVAVAVLDLRAERVHGLDVEVNRAATDPVAAGVADDHSTVAGQDAGPAG